MGHFFCIYPWTMDMKIKWKIRTRIWCLVCVDNEPSFQKSLIFKLKSMAHPGDHFDMWQFQTPTSNGCILVPSDDFINQRLYEKFADASDYRQFACFELHPMVNSIVGKHEQCSKLSQNKRAIKIDHLSIHSASVSYHMDWIGIYLVMFIWAQAV